jgi:2'-5' RNA ligase
MKDRGGFCSQWLSGWQAEGNGSKHLPVENESAIVVPVPEAESLVAEFRHKYDRSASLGVPAHITLLYPFLPPHLAQGEIQNLTELFGAIPAFEFSLVEVRRFPRTAYLHPDPVQRFTGIVMKLVERWPVCRPYRGAFTETIPHLTVADEADSDTLEGAQRRLANHLPITCMAREAWLLCSNDAGFWSRKASFQFLPTRFPELTPQSA